MMRIKQFLKNIFLLRSFLYLLQLEEYMPWSFFKLALKNPFPKNVEKVKTLVWTTKAKIIFGLSILLFLFQQFLIYSLFGLGIFFIIGIAVFIFFSWIYLIISTLMMVPLEVSNRIRLKIMTRKKVNRMKKQGMKLIGITGSYGKTSTKKFLNQILQKNFKVFATPKSHNTLFGIAQTKMISNVLISALDHLPQDLDYFIVEMAAYWTGEIRELTRAYPPDIGILTGITTMHFEKFGSLENTIKAKSELVSGLPDGGKLFINYDNIHTRVICNKEKSKSRLNVFSVGLDEKSDYQLIIKSMSKDGTEFSLRYDNDKHINFTTGIIGTGNISNIGLALAVAIEVGVSEDTLINSVSQLQPAESRMEILDPGTGIITINNGYSSNPESFKQSLKTLDFFDLHHKVLVTPGIFELGDITREVHEKLGSMISDNVELVMLLGKNKDNDRLKGLLSGLKSTGYPEERIIFIDDIKKCYNVVLERGLLPAVVVLENDLPDRYNI